MSPSIQVKTPQSIYLRGFYWSVLGAEYVPAILPEHGPFTYPGTE